MIRLAAAFFVLAIATALPAGAEQRFPPPDFTDHKLPELAVPELPPIEWEYVDLAFLVVALGIASYSAVVSRSRRQLFLLSLVSLAWLGFRRKGCICAIGAIQNMALAAFDSHYVVPLTVVAFFALPIAFTLFFGRTFCAGVCPLGAVQELVAIRPIRVPPWLEQSLGLLRYVYLGAAVAFAATGAAFLICRYDPFVAAFRVSGGFNMLVFGIAMLVLGAFVGRPYCRFLCPLGAILGLCSKVSKWHVRIPPQDCLRCRLCEDACPYGAILEPTLPQDPEQRPAARRYLAWAIVLAPAWIAAGAILGHLAAVPMSKLDPTFRTAEQVRLEEDQPSEKVPDAVDAFRRTGHNPESLYQQAASIIDRNQKAGTWLGAWCGLVFAAKLIQLASRRPRRDYEPDRAGCVACGRCFWYCPAEQERLGLIQNPNGPPLACETAAAAPAPSSPKRT